jgi:hypothetical protein
MVMDGIAPSEIYSGLIIKKETRIVNGSDEKSSLKGPFERKLPERVLA